jgi:hypothetical protein
MLYSNYNPERIYVGITKTSLYQRFKTHKKAFNGWLNNKTNICGSFKIFNDYGVDNIHMELLEETYNSKDEYWWIELLGTENNYNGKTFNKKEYDKKYQQTEKYKECQKNQNAKRNKINNAKRNALNYLKKLFN